MHVPIFNAIYFINAYNKYYNKCIVNTYNYIQELLVYSGCATSLRIFGKPTKVLGGQRGGLSVYPNILENKSSRGQTY